MPSEDLLDALLPVAAAAGEEIRDVAAGGIESREKSDASPVTEADERAERMILDGLSRLAPGELIIAEEQAAAGGLPETAADAFWLVDPLDGTKEFIKGGADYTVNIARIKDCRPVMGLVYCPADGRVFAGSLAGGAWRGLLDHAGRVTERAPIRTRRAADPLTIVASKSHGNADTQAYLARYPMARHVSIGSSLKFCLVSAGEADLYPRLGPTMEWDTAAGHAVLLAAGGRMTDADGADFRYYKPGFRNGHFLAWGDPAFSPSPLSRG